MDFNVDYHWEITTLSGGPYDGDPLPITEENNIKLIFNSEGVYNICLTTVSFSCSQFNWNGNVCRTVTIDDIVGLQELDVSNIKITPNPTFDNIAVDGDTDFSEATYFIYSIDGQQLLSGNLDSSKKINVMDLPAGLYVISIAATSGENAKTRRFVKE